MPGQSLQTATAGVRDTIARSLMHGLRGHDSTLREHILRLYEDDASLAHTVGELVADGLARKETCLLIATREHLNGITRELNERGHDCGLLEENKRLFAVDARETMHKIAPGGDLDIVACRQALKGLISEVADGGQPIVAYGELVDLLCKAGKPEAAIRLEQIWNDLQKEHPIYLLCGYDAHMFRTENRPLLELVCNEHSVSLPSEEYLIADERSRLRQVVVLEQRARELESELDRRRAATEEVARFNRAAVGREMRIIALKEEVNDLCTRLGEAVRYSNAAEPEKAEVCSPATPKQLADLPPLESILVTEQLEQRPSRPPQLEAEHGALMALMQALADSPRTVLQVLADKVLEVLQADSAGLSLLTEDGDRFYWAAIAGMWKPHIGGGTPRNFGPCGDVLDCKRPLLFTHWEKRYPYLAQATPLAEEGLLVPFFVRGKAVGTIWAIAHNAGRKFDAEDLRLLESLSRFASAAHQAVQTLGVFEQRQAALSLLEDHVQQEKRLSEANHRLARANEDLSHFTFAASHDLQEPLRMVSAYSQLLTKRYELERDEETATCIRFIREGTNRMQQLLADLLTYTQLIGDTGKASVSFVDLNMAFRKALEGCRAAVDDCGGRITSDPLPTISGYEPHFIGLFQNLIANAVKYRSEQPLRLHVSSKAEEGRWRIAVADNGIGIEPQYHKMIFGVFKRLHGKEIPGTGVGLAVCQRVVERYGGRIWVESKKNQGATFYFTLPAAAEEVLSPELSPRSLTL